VSLRPEPDRGCGPVTVELSAAQIDFVVRIAATGGVVPLLFSGLPRVRQVVESDQLLVNGERDKRLSWSLLQGLLLLAWFPADGTWLSNTEAARRAGMETSTAHRYVSTLVEAGLLERDSKSREYRLAPSSGQRPYSSGCVEPSDDGSAVGIVDEACSGEPPAVIELSSGQVDMVLRVAAQKGTLSALLAGLAGGSDAPSAALEQLEDARFSSSLLTGLLILAVLPLDGSLIANADLARHLGMNSSTTHRYVRTLRAVGLVERDPKTRSYRLAR
jgi:DNA-binding MarR family transcriptional regulator